MTYTIAFKSKPEFYLSEYQDLKNNTVRDIIPGEKKWDDLLSLMEAPDFTPEKIIIEITNTDSGMKFRRVCANLTKFRSERQNTPQMIITWHKAAETRKNEEQELIDLLDQADRPDLRAAMQQEDRFQKKVLDHLKDIKKAIKQKC